MIAQKIIHSKVPFLILIVILVTIHIIWDYYNGGVPTHYLLHNEDLPGFSNWWGLLTIPLATILSLHLIQYQYKVNSNPKKFSDITYGFIRGLLLGLMLSILWLFDLPETMPFIIGLPIIISMFIPVHYPQHFLGFIFGMSYTFGGVLPIIIGLALVILSFLAWTIFRKIIPTIYKKIF